MCAPLRTAGLLALALAALACGAAVARPPSVRLVAGPHSIVAGETWTGTVRTAGPGRPTVSPALGARSARAEVARTAPHRYRIRVRLDAVGTWRLTATLARRRFALGSITVRAKAPYALDSPAYPLVLPDGSVLVAERGLRNRLLRVDPASGAFSVFARGIPSPFELGLDRDGSVLASSTSGLYRIGADGAPTRVSEVSVSPFALLPSGEFAFGNESTVGILSLGGEPRILPVDVEAPHGIGLLPDGDLVLSDTGHGRILRIDPASGTSSVVTTELRTPMGLVAEPSGSILVLEFESGRLVRISPSGTTATVADGLHTPYGLARADDGTVYVTEVGEVRRATGALRRVSPDGTLTTIRLIAR